MIENVTETVGQVTPAVNQEFVGERQIRGVPVTRPETPKFDVNQVFFRFHHFCRAIFEQCPQKISETNIYQSYCPRCKNMKESKKFCETGKDVRK